MINSKRIHLKDIYNLEGGELDIMALPYPFDGEVDALPWSRPAMIVVPGGGYQMVSEREADIVGTRYLSLGYQVFVLRYNYAPISHYPEPLLELASSVDYIRHHAKELHVDPERIFAVGFSAGGHLVGDLAAEWSLLKERHGFEGDAKINGIVLAYPVIYPEGHPLTFANCLGGKKLEDYPWLSLDTSVSKHNPPAFIWSTNEDTLVPCENSLKYALALRKAKIKFQLCVYPYGEHGLSTAEEEINERYYPQGSWESAKRWIDESDAFLRSLKSK